MNGTNGSDTRICLQGYRAIAAQLKLAK